jgi:hypothetical protein
MIPEVIKGKVINTRATPCNQLVLPIWIPLAASLYYWLYTHLIYVYSTGAAFYFRMLQRIWNPLCTCASFYRPTLDTGCTKVFLHVYITVHEKFLHIWNSLYMYTIHHIYRVPQEESAILREGVLNVIYTDITQNIFVQSWTVTEIMAREKCGLLAVPRAVRLSWLGSSVCPWLGSPIAVSCISAVFVAAAAQSAMLSQCVTYSAWNSKASYDTACEFLVVRFNGVT